MSNDGDDSGDGGVSVYDSDENNNYGNEGK